jgi:pimeloyl-ACP methyl ester carboxylesterase
LVQILIGVIAALAVISINESPLNPGISPVEIYYRDWGNGVPLIFLHGGWGYEIYPFDRQIEVFGDRFRILIPDRSGYGRSMRISRLETDFHKRAAVEMTNFLDALGIDKAVLWGHSDGAVISAIMGLNTPSRFLGLILEAFHYDRNKVRSREFFEMMASNPEKFGERVSRVLASDHGEDYWRKLLGISGQAWLKIIEESDRPEKDFYDLKLSKLEVPTIFIHGSRDPRTEPGELDTVRNLLPHAQIQLIEGGGHSPHSESSAYFDSNLRVEEFFKKLDLL